MPGEAVTVAFVLPAQGPVGQKQRPKATRATSGERPAERL